MKRILVLFLVGLFFIGCSNSKKTNEIVDHNEIIIQDTLVYFNSKPFTGTSKEIFSSKKYNKSKKSFGTRFYTIMNGYEKDVYLEYNIRYRTYNSGLKIKDTYVENPINSNIKDSLIINYEPVSTKKRFWNTITNENIDLYGGNWTIGDTLFRIYETGKLNGELIRFKNNILVEKQVYLGGEIKEINSYFDDGSLRFKGNIYKKRDYNLDQEIPEYDEWLWEGVYEEYDKKGNIINKFDYISSVGVLEYELQPKTNLGKISFEESKEFMVERCRNINQQLVKSFVTNFDGNDVYMFFTLSTDRPGYSCVSLMTPFKLEILSTDFNLNEVKVSEWNNIPGSPKI
jgi:hypothetical protein